MIGVPSWSLNQQNLIKFVLVDGLGNEVSGLGTAWVIQLTKPNAAFVTGTGTKSETSDGWYQYLASANEADTPGMIGVKITHASIKQQNLAYVVETYAALSVSFTYTVTDTATGFPLEAVCVTFTTDANGNNIVWSGFTDALGVARDIFGQLPRLDPGTYYVFRQKTGYVFPSDTEVVT